MNFYRSTRVRQDKFQQVEQDLIRMGLEVLLHKQDLVDNSMEIWHSSCKEILLVLTLLTQVLKTSTHMKQRNQVRVAQIHMGLAKEVPLTHHNLTKSVKPWEDRHPLVNLAKIHMATWHHSLDKVSLAKILSASWHRILNSSVIPIGTKLPLHPIHMVVHKMPQLSRGSKIYWSKDRHRQLLDHSMAHQGLVLKEAQTLINRWKNWNRCELKEVQQQWHKLVHQDQDKQEMAQLLPLPHVHNNSSMATKYHHLPLVTKHPTPPLIEETCKAKSHPSSSKNQHQREQDRRKLFLKMIRIWLEYELKNVV